MDVLGRVQPHQHRSALGYCRAGTFTCASGNCYEVDLQALVHLRGATNIEIFFHRDVYRFTIFSFVTDAVTPLF